MAETIVPRLALPDALRDPSAYPHPVERVEVIETHISWVLLAGEFAYKVKKPVKLPFLDFTSVAARRFYCEEELRLNRRTAPELYLDIVTLAGEPAVRMRRFAQEDLLAQLAHAGRLDGAIVDALAEEVAALHGAASVAPPDRRAESAERATRPALDNFREIAAIEEREPERRRLDLLRRWTEVERQALAGVFAERRNRGFVRECHGDLHLGNVVLVGGRPAIFDALEFSLRLRWGDVMSDVAFMATDLAFHGLPGLAARFVNAYLEATGDYEGIAVLRFYMVYRAMVRAKVERIRAAQSSGAAREAALASFAAYLKLARTLAGDGLAALVLMHGPSGSGKTHVSQRLVEELRAVRARSDVERRRMFGTRGYSREEGRRVYARLADIAAIALAADFPVVVDAACLERAQRDLFAGVAGSARAPLHIVSCTAPLETLRLRVGRRGEHGGDASEADCAVLYRQLALQQPLEDDEMPRAVVLDTADGGAWRAVVRRLVARIRFATDSTAHWKAQCTSTSSYPRTDRAAPSAPPRTPSGSRRSSARA